MLSYWWQDMMELSLWMVNRLQESMVQQFSDIPLAALLLQPSLCRESIIVADTLFYMLLGECPTSILLGAVADLDPLVHECTWASQTSSGGSRDASSLHTKVVSFERLVDSSIMLPSVFPALCTQLAFRYNPSALTIDLLVNLSALLKRECNCASILSIFGWQSYVTRMVGACVERISILQEAHGERLRRDPSQAPAASSPTGQDEAKGQTRERSFMDLTFRIFNILHMNALQNGYHHVLKKADGDLVSLPDCLKNEPSHVRRQGILLVMETLCFIRFEAMHGVLDGAQVGSAVLERLVREFQQNVDPINHRLANQGLQSALSSVNLPWVAENIWPLAAIVINFIIYPPVQRIGAKALSYVDLGRSEDSPGLPVAPGVRLNFGTLERPGARKTRSVGASWAASAFNCVANPAIWRLVRLITELLGLSSGSLAWSLEALLTAEDLARLVHETDAIFPFRDTFDDLAVGQSLGSWLDPLTGGKTPTQAGRATARTGMGLPASPSWLVFAGSTPWVMLRVISAVALLGGYDNATIAVMAPEVTSTGSVPVSVEAIGLLTPLLQVMADVRYRRYKMEVLHLLGSFTKVLIHTTLPGGSAWVQEALRFVEALVTEHASMLVARYRDAVHPRAPPKARDYVRRNSEPAALGPHREPAHVSGGDQAVRKLRALGLTQPETDSPAVQLSKRLAVALGLDVRGVDLTVWESMFDPVVEMGLRQQEAYLVRQMDYGRGPDSLDNVSNVMESLDGRLAQMLGAASEGVKTWVGRVRDRHRVKNVEMIKGLEKKKRGALAQWMRVLEELANERGPWGRGSSNAALSQSLLRIYWTLDEVEDLIRRRLKLRRNGQGSNHLIPSQKRNACESHASPPPGDRESLAKAAEPADGGGAGADGASGSSSAQTLWRELVKYQRSNNAGVELVEEEEEGGEQGAEGEAGGGEAGAGEGLERRKKAPPKQLKSLSSQGSKVDDMGRGAEDERGAGIACEVVQHYMISPGTLELGTSTLTFTLQEGFNSPVPQSESHSWALRPMATNTWQLDDLRRIFYRLYQQRPVALEFFFLDRTSIFLKFRSQQVIPPGF
jgi:hypothetical protein